MDTCPELPAQRPPPDGARSGRWLRTVVVVASLLALTGYLNIWLNESSADSTQASSALLQLNSRLQEEGTLQWRALAERGMPTRVAADVGHVRASEDELIDELAHVLPAVDVAELRRLIDDYHVALDEELSLLAVGRTADAIAFETAETSPRFASLSDWLRDHAKAAATEADRRGHIAHVLLVAALTLAAAVIAALVWRADRSHRLALSVSRKLLDQEREQVESLRRTQEEIRHQAEHDPLTGLPNRLLFNRRLGDAAGRSNLAILFVDLDGFKPVNDRWGHAAGDELLVAVGERLRRCARGTDTVARLGGDEFAVLLDGADAVLAQEVADRIVERLGRPVQLSTGAVTVGASVGVALGTPGADPDHLLSEADDRMYAMKQAGRRHPATPV